MSQFQSLSFNEDGYVMRCTECNHFHVAFGSTLLTLSTEDFTVLRRLVKYKCSKRNYAIAEYAKSVVIPTPYEGQYLLLSEIEMRSFSRMLEEADDEARAQSLLDLFKNK